MRSYLIIPDPQNSVSYVDQGGGIINKGQLASSWPVGVPVACLSCEGSCVFREVESRIRIMALDLDLRDLPSGFTVSLVSSSVKWG